MKNWLERCYFLPLLYASSSGLILSTFYSIISLKAQIPVIVLFAICCLILGIGLLISWFLELARESAGIIKTVKATWKIPRRLETRISNMFQLKTRRTHADILIDNQRPSYYFLRFKALRFVFSFVRIR